MSDIKFDGEYVLIEGTWTKLATLDLMLDAPSRRRVSWDSEERWCMMETTG